MVVTGDSNSNRGASESVPPDFHKTAINTHVSSTSYSLDKPPLQGGDGHRSDSPVAGFFGSLRALFHRDLSFDLLSVLLILLLLTVAYWFGSALVSVFTAYFGKIQQAVPTN